MADGLQVEGLTLTYGAAEPAVHTVSLEVPRGGIVTVLGANGAGKTSLVRGICGHAAQYGAKLTGRVRFGGVDITSNRPGAAVKAGLVHVPEGRQVFSGLTVRDNLLAGAFSRRLSKGDAAHDIERVLDIFPALAKAFERPAGLLSGGQQQMLAVGRGLMSRPQLLICDELSLGLAPLTARDLVRTLAELGRATGMSILLIEQNARLALSAADYAYVMNVGEFVSQGTSQQFRENEDLQTVYLGGSL